MFASNRNIRIISAVMLTPFASRAQSQVDLANQTRNVNFSNAPFTRPVKTGTAQPVTCTIGDLFFNTAAPAGQNLYACVGSNTWTLETGGGSGGGSPAGSNGDFQRNNSGSLGAANINQNSDGSLNASAGVTEPAPSLPTYNAGGTTNCDLSRSTACQLNASGPTTLTVTNPHGSGPYTFITSTDASGPYSITLPGSFKGAPPMSAAASTTTIVICTYDGTTSFNCGYTEAPSVIRFTTERALPAAPTTGSVCAPDSTGHMLRCINSAGTTFSVAKEISGVRRGNGANSVDTTAAASDIVALFSTCSGTQYLGADGTCHTVSGGGGVTNTTPWILPFGAADSGSTAVLPQNGAILVAAVTFGNSTQIGKIILPLSVSGSKHGAWSIFTLDGNTRLATGTATSLCGGCGQTFALSATVSAGTYYLAFSTDDAAGGTYNRTSANFGSSLGGTVTTPLTATAAGIVTWSAGAATWPTALGALTSVANAPLIAIAF
jgi:hypothetical protein